MNVERQFGASLLRWSGEGAAGLVFIAVLNGLHRVCDSPTQEPATRERERAANAIKLLEPLSKS